MGSVLAWEGRWPSWSRLLVATTVPTALVTLLALFPRHVGVGSAALAYVVAVAVATALGSGVSGVVASLLSFAALHYFFTPPRGTLLHVPSRQDLVALFAFLVVSILIGLMLSAAMIQRRRAERSAGETRVLHELTARLLAGERIERVLEAFAASVTHLLGLAACEVVTVYAPERVVAGDVGALEAAPEGFAMVVRGRPVGSLRVVPSGRSEPRHDEVQSLRLFADQLALALDTVELASQVRDAQFEADASNVRAALFASVTHDLRTPLASILASATTLRSEGALEPEVRGELVDAICEEADRLNRLVGNLLELSRIRAGAMTPSKTPTPVDELVGGVLARLRRSLGGHDVVTSIPTDLPEVPMDVVQMDQVVTNLLENAMRFAPAGTPIRVTAERDDGDIRIAIVDEGPGIPSADRERVFEPFVRGSAGGGAGLGLAICRAIVESHGGTIRVDDRRERGAAVIVELPLDGA